MNKWVIGLGIFCATLSVGLSGVFSDTASAASVYDDNYRTTDSLVVETASCDLVDMTMTWGGFISNKDNWTHTPAHYDTYYPMIYAAISNGAFAVSQVISGEPSNPSGYDPFKAIDIIFSTPNTPLIWSTRSIYTQSRSVRITTEFWNGASNCNLSVYMANTNLDNHVISNDVLPPITNLDSPMVYNFMAYEWQYNYPTAYGYDGPEIRESFTPPVVFDPELSAKYSWSDKSIVFEDTTVYDVMPDECWVQMPNNASGDNFTEYYFDCNSKPPVGHTIEALEYQSYTIIQFARLDNTTVSENYSITIDGGSGDSEIGSYSASNFFNQCIDYDPPFIHVSNCQNAFGVIANKLSFGKINPFTDIRYSQLTECRQLEVLGSWINYESKLVCPAFNSTVRNIVTPFVAFGLSLTALGFILNRTARDFQ